MNKSQLDQGPKNSPLVYSVPLISSPEPVGETPIYRHPDAVASLAKTIKRIPHVTTLQQLHDLNSKVYSDMNCLGSRVRNPDGSLGPYVFKTFNTVNKIARQAGSAIYNLDLAPIVQAKGYADCRFVAVYGPNTEEWMLLDIASALYGITVLPIFATLGVESLQYIFDHTSVTTIFCAGTNLDRLISEGAAKKLGQLRNIICFSGYNATQKKAAEQGGIQLLSWNEFLSFGESKILDYPVVTPDTVFTITYTSGTTGNPKGVMLTHRNFIAAYAGAEDRNGYDINAVGKGDVHLSYLTLAHIFERFFSHMILGRGVTIGFFSGDVQKLTADLQALKPTFMISAPRLYNKFYDNIQAMLSKLKSDKVVINEDKTLTIKDPAILQQLRNITGGRVKAYYSGSAPIDPDVARFLKTAFSAPLMEAFGQTEIAGGGFSQRAEDSTFGHIGGIFSSLEFKLVDVPEMNYTSKDKGPNGELMPRGELCLRGDQIFKAYYKEPEKTAETIDEHGWHHTGDIGMVLPNGSVKLIDRKKNIFKLAQGEYIAPEKLENVYLTNKYVAEVFIYGDPHKSYTVGVIVPEKDNLISLAKQLGLGDKSFEELCKDKQVIAFMLQELNKTGRAAKLAGYEIVQKIYLDPQSLALSGLMTATMKLKRNVAKVYYEKVITDLYRRDDSTQRPRL